MMRAALRPLSLLALALLAGCAPGGEERGKTSTATESSAGGAAIAPSAEPSAFDARLAEIARTFFELTPETATYYGAPAAIAGDTAARSVNARSPAAEKRRRAEMETALATLKELSASATDARQRRIADTLIAQLDGALAPSRIAEYGATFNVYGFWFTPYPVIQNSGVLVDLPNLMEAQQAVASEKDAEDYLARLSGFAVAIDQSIEKIESDRGLGVAPPDFVLEKTLAVIANFVSTQPEKHVLVESFGEKLRKAGVNGADALVARAAEVLRAEVYPAQARMSGALEALKVDARHDAGVWRLPRGAELYQALIRHMTDTSLSADEIHDIGLREVERIVGEMDAILKSQGYAEGSVGERMRLLATEPRFYPNTEEGKARILADIAGQVARVEKIAPQWFGTLPKYALEVRAVPSFSQDSAPSGYYDSPAVDGSRPGIYWINLRDTAIWPNFAVPTLTYHEAVPGHHFQNSLALANDSPLLASVFSSNAFGEGWALYAEALAKEMGLYEGDPFGDLGRLQDELHRAIRLVVDTGMHAKRWSREQAIEYMSATEGIDPREVESEIERYVVWPGQALGYKIGMLKIQELRRRAEGELQGAFDIRAFHDVVLGSGGVPLPVLEANVEAWIAARREAKE